MRGRERLLLCEWVADVAGHRAAGAVVAALLDPPRQLLDARLTGVEGNRRRLGDRVGLDHEYSGPPTENLLDDRLLARVVEPADVEHDRRGRVGLAPLSYRG